MKKTFEQKLSLKKQTVTNLEQNNVRGGGPSKWDPNCCSMACTGPTCPMTSDYPYVCGASY